MQPLFEITPVDRECYDTSLRDWLPDRMIDIHTHVWLKRFNEKPRKEPGRTVSWPSRVANENTAEQLSEAYALMFPGKTVLPLMFANLAAPRHFEAANDYVSQASRRHGFPALIFSDPRWSAKAFETAIAAGGFLGAKSYLTLAPSYLPTGEIRIFDFFPHHQLEVINRRGWIMMLHIPRDGRLRDPVNLVQLLDIEARYPAIKLIVAHVGRAYCPEDLGHAFKVLSKSKTLCFDISANTNMEAFRRLLDTLGPKRVLFGSDMPIARMRMRRICERGVYVNIVPKGLYGDVSGDTHMREVRGQEARRLTFFMYEELKAFRRAVEAAGLSRGDLEDMFYQNAFALIAGARGTPKVPQLQMIWPNDKVSSRPSVDVPADYELRTYQPGDEEAYIALMRAAGFEKWGPAQFQSVMKLALPEGLFFLVHRATGRLAATAVATHNPTACHPFGGELGWVAVHPDHRGHGLARVICAAVTRRFLEGGYADLYLNTDDFRLPAIKTYWKLGWVSCEDTPDMRARWQAVREKLNWPA